eukprot:COSAG04_NODE_12676_length_640_cov_0.892791_1_plen_51_part_10
MAAREELALAPQQRWPPSSERPSALAVTERASTLERRTVRCRMTGPHGVFG